MVALWCEEIKDQPFDGPLCGGHKNNWPAVTWLTLQSIPNHKLVGNSEIIKLGWALRLADIIRVGKEIDGVLIMKTVLTVSFV